jgi:hypothetical protein
MGKWLTCLPRLTLAQLRTLLRSTTGGVRAAETLKTSHHPDGKVADLLAPTHACTTANIWSTTGGACRRDNAKFPSPPMEISRLFARCRAAVSVSYQAAPSRLRLPQSTGIELELCVLMFKSSHGPDGEMADVLAPTHACTTANALVNYSGCMPQRPCKFPIAPMGDSRVARCMQGGGVAVSHDHYGGTVVISSSTISGNSAGNVCAHAQKFPSSRWDFNMFCACAFRVAVFTTQLAMCVLMLKSSDRPHGRLTFARC